MSALLTVHSALCASSLAFLLLTSQASLKPDIWTCLRAGLVYRAMGFPPQFFTVLFAIPRVTGYLAHWREQLNDPDVKIARPQQNYTVCLCCSQNACSPIRLK